MSKSLPDLAALLSSWQLALRAERKSPSTIRAYGDGVRLFLGWCADRGHPAELTRAAVQAFLADMLDAGAEANTARARDQALKRFAAWLTAEGELPGNPLLGLKPPQASKKVVHALSDDELKRMIKACRGTTLLDRRDEAIIRLMAETGLRAAEVIALNVGDVDLANGLATVHRGKGDKGRVVPFGAQTAAAIDRYLRARKVHRLAATGALWLGSRGRGFGYDGLSCALKARAAAAGVEGFHLHLMRHTAATRWLRAGGSEQGLMAVAGWSDRTMLDRYTSASAASRAADESRRLNLGDL